jgi:PAS domain S-box-containing protein
MTVTWLVLLSRKLSRQTSLIQGQLQLETAIAERYRDLFQNSTDLVFTVDMNGAFSAMNFAAKQVFGCTDQDTIGLTLHTFIEPADRRTLKDVFGMLIGGERSVLREITTIAACGRRVVLEMNCRLRHGCDGPNSVDIIARDITHQKREQAALEEARAAAEAASCAKSEFLANMSHEIRTPLNGVLAMAEVMAMGHLDEVQRDRLDVIRRSGSLLLAVLNDVLDLSKIEAGKLTLFEDDFDLEAVVVQARDSFSVMAQAKSLDFAVEVAEDAAGWWRGDADRLRQIVGNLISNAVKFTPQGSVTASFEMSAAGGLKVIVRDTGVGIAPEKLPSLFEKFTQADNSATRRFGGTGLGLAICRELTQMMGGSINVESCEGQGSTFTVELPLKRGRPSSVPVSETAAAADDGDLRLLAAEDNPTNQQVLAAVLGSLGIEVHIVPDGKEAVEAWRTGVYDLILMDIQMPVMDGITAAMKIRAAEQETGRRRTPIVALTANAMSHQVEEYLAAGMDAHVAKPIEIAKLYDSIASTLNAAATGGASGRTGAQSAA